MKLLNLVFILLVLNISLAFAQETPLEEPPVEEPVAEPALICSDSQCDNGCIKCSDRKCHEPDFECVEKVAVEKIFPKELSFGESQINIGLKNTGNVDLKDIFAEISGDGITTLERISVSKLAVSDKDYIFVKINATKSGIIDVVIKMYVDEEVKGKFLEQFKVSAPVVSQNEIQPNPQPAVNITLLQEQVDSMMNKQSELETLYQEKSDAGYPVELIYDKLKQTSEYIAAAQAAMIEGDYKKVQASLAVLQNSLPDIEARLNSAKKQEESLGDKIKENLLLYGSIAAALISILTAYRLVSSSIDHKKLIKKLGKKKVKELEKKEKAKKQKEEDKTDEE